MWEMWKSFFNYHKKNERFTHQLQVLNTQPLSAPFGPINPKRVSYRTVDNIHKKTKSKEALAKNKSNTKSNDEIDKGAKTRTCLPTNFLKAWIRYVADH